MEEEKKKRKKNKKKKNKEQQIDKAATEDDAPDRVVEGNHVGNKNNEGGDVERDKVSDDCVVDSSAAQDEKQLILQEKGNLENSLKQLRCENDLISEEKASLESKVMELQSDKESCLLKEASLEEKICKLSNEKAFLSSEQNSTKEVISMMELDIKRLHLQVSELEELNNHSVQENFALKDYLSKLQTQIHELEKNASINHSLDRDIKEVLEDKIQQLEGECQSWVSKENSSKDEIANMGNEIKRLRLQVVEIEDLKGNAVEENLSLKECICELQERIKELEKSSSLAITSEEQAKVQHAMEHENLNSQIEAACALVEKLIAENAELVEKVNELYLEVDQQNTAVGLSMPPSSKYSIQVAGNTCFQDEQPKSYEITPADSETIFRDKEVIRDAFPLNPLGSFKTGEIVQIPLDDVEAQVMESQETVPSLAVPISDAPLVGAPFRLISFMARYVTGADLVDKTKA